MHGNIPKNNGTESLSQSHIPDNQNCDLLYQAMLLLPLNDELLAIVAVLFYRVNVGIIVSSILPEENSLIGPSASNELPLWGLRVCGR